MKLLDSHGPNPRLVRMFAIEKGIEMATEELDMWRGDNRTEAYLARNPAGQMPALEFDDGTVLAETVVICEYLEERYPRPVLVGAHAEERANTRMWIRRVELNITEHMYNGFRFAEGLDICRNRVYCMPEAAEGFKAKARDRLKWLDELIAGRNYIAGDKFSLADIVLYCCMDFCKDVGQPLDSALHNINAWFSRVYARESARKSLHPSTAKIRIAG